MLGDFYRNFIQILVCNLYPTILGCPRIVNTGEDFMIRTFVFNDFVFIYQGGSFLLKNNKTNENRIDNQVTIIPVNLVSL